MMKARALHGGYVMPSGNRVLPGESDSGAATREKRADVSDSPTFFLSIP